MKKAAIFCVGKLKCGFWQDACSHYLKRLASMRQMECVEVRDSSLAGLQRLRQEAEKLESCLAPGDLAIALTEHGELLTSPQLAEKLRYWDEHAMKRPCFIIGGPYGLDEEFVKKCDFRLSLSPMTWPHELARVLLLEQLYRAQGILAGSPYHHA